MENEYRVEMMYLGESPEDVLDTAPNWQIIAEGTWEKVRRVGHKQIKNLLNNGEFCLLRYSSKWITDNRYHVFCVDMPYEGEGYKYYKAVDWAQALRWAIKEEPDINTRAIIFENLVFNAIH